MQQIKNFRHHYSKFEKRDFPFIYLLIALPVLQFAVFWIYVNISSIMLTFQNPDGEFTFANIKAVFRAFNSIDRYGLDLSRSLKNSVKIWTLGFFVTFPLSVITTYVLQRRIIGHYVWRICYIIPGLLGSVIWINLVKYMFAYDGIVVELLIKMGVELPEKVLLGGLLNAEETAMSSVILLNFIMGLAGNNVVLTGAFSRIPEELYESAALDGAGFWTECFRIGIPCVWSTIAMLLTFKLTGIFTADNGVFLYTNGTGEPGMSTVGFHLYFMQYKISLTGAGRASFGYPAALGFVLTMMTMPIVLIGRRLLENAQEAVEL